MNALVQLSAARQAVMAKLREAKASRLSPLPLQGAEARTARGLVERRTVREGTGGFYIPTDSDPPEQVHERKWRACGPHLVDPDGSERLDLQNEEAFIAELAAALNCYHKLPRAK